ncbi:MAG: polyketide cyclase [Lysobacteraceae bacterium]|nr:MAG: polyketide cyclase [Xanthomonadaceae bacterium]
MSDAESKLSRKQRIRALLMGIESGDPDSVQVIHPRKYIQHNPQTHEGRDGLAALFKRLSQRSPKVNIVRLFSDGDFVFGQTEYDFGSPRVGFEVFRFEGDFTVEHWDNIQPRRPAHAPGLTMVDGAIEASDHAKTELNRSLVATFVDEVLVGGQVQQRHAFLAPVLIDHSPSAVAGSAPSLGLALAESGEDVRYQKLHRVLAEGDFVLSVSEGTLHGVHSSFYDLFRIDNGKAVEHWSTTEAVPPRSEWKNDNGKF